MAKNPEKDAVPAETFIVTWQGAKCMEDVAGALELKLESVRSRAKSLVAKGVRLKQIPKSLNSTPRIQHDYSKLANLAEQHLPKGSAVFTVQSRPRKAKDGEGAAAGAAEG